MTQRIYKYMIGEPSDIINFILPAGAQILTVQVQNGIPCLWALIDDMEKRMETRRIRMVGTGHKIEAVGKYIGTIQLHGGRLVVHFFEL